MRAGLIMITRLVRKCLYRTMVSSTKQNPDTKRAPWTIASVHTNGKISIQYGNKSVRMNIWRVKLFKEN
jgi:hypothetical protein